MSDVSVLSRIDQIRSAIAGLQTQPVAAVSGASFATSLAAATQAAASPAAALPTSTAGSTAGADVVASAKRYLGVPYRWGGTDPKTGLDCSGFVQRVFADLGVQVPRTVSQQKDAGTPVASLAQAQPGDLLVFDDSHIGIYAGNGKMVASPKTGDVVKVQDVYETPSRIRRVVGSGESGIPSAPAAGIARPSALRGNESGPSSYDSLFAAATQRYGLPASLLKAVAKAESGFNPTAVSPVGARGLMQLMPGTARGLGVDPFDPAQAVDGAARLLRQNLDAFGSVPLALAAYNAGAGAVRKYGGVPPYGETQTYVKRVLATMGRSA